MSDPTPTPAQTDTPLEQSPRFAPERTRRDWLGLAAIWSAASTFVVAMIGAMRLPMPAVFPESQSKVKLGPPDTFGKGTSTYLNDLSLWLYRDDDGGMYAISSVCTHLGCLARREDNGHFVCPCHGSIFNPEGKVTAGPAPGPLHWLELTLAPDGHVVVDKTRQVKPGTRLTA